MFSSLVCELFVAKNPLFVYSHLSSMYPYSLSESDEDDDYDDVSFSYLFAGLGCIWWICVE